MIEPSSINTPDARRSMFSIYRAGVSVAALGNHRLKFTGPPDVLESAVFDHWVQEAGPAILQLLYETPGVPRCPQT